MELSSVQYINSSATEVAIYKPKIVDSQEDESVGVEVSVVRCLSKLRRTITQSSLELTRQTTLVLDNLNL